MVFSNLELFILFSILLTVVSVVWDYVYFYKAVLVRQFRLMVLIGLMVCLSAAGTSPNICVFAYYNGADRLTTAFDVITPFVFALLVLLLTGFSIQSDVEEINEVKPLMPNS